MAFHWEHGYHKQSEDLYPHQLTLRCSLVQKGGQDVRSVLSGGQWAWFYRQR